MKRIIATVLLCSLTAGLAAGCTEEIPVIPSETSETATAGPVRPQDDYYRYINGEKLANARFEYGDSIAADAFNDKMITEQVEGIISDIASGSGYSKGSEEDVIKTAYDAFLDYDFANEPIPEDLVKMIDDIQNCNTVDELMKIDAVLSRHYGLSGLLHLSVSYDFFNAGEKILLFSQLTSVMDVSFEEMRDDNFAADDVAENASIIMQTLDHDKDSSDECGVKIANLAIELYGSTNMDIIDTDWDYIYMEILSKDEIDNILTNVDLSEYVKTVGFDGEHCDRFCVIDKGQLIRLNEVLSDKNIEALKVWEINDLYGRYMRFIAPHHKLLAYYVTDSYDTPEKQAVNEISHTFYLETDPVYVERYYTKETDDALVSMCDDIRNGYRDLISNASWLTENTRKGLLAKLENIVYITGMDRKRHDDTKFKDLSGNYFEILMQYQKIIMKDSIDSLATPVNRKEIAMPMQMFNACYDPTANTITITVAITNAPFFDADADYYTNLGGLGSVIAHEMGHAFDSNCIVFDENGVYDPDWIAPEDMESLTERNKRAVTYFENNFTVFGVYHVDGEQTLGENYADLGGMECVTSLAKTNEDLEKIFANYAAVWCRKRVDSTIIDLLAYDEHSPEIIRTNAILSTLDCFYDVYDVKEGDGMYIAPENRISRWY